MSRFLKLLMIIVIMTISPLVSSAQSASEYYNTGLSLMKKKDFSGAIASFKASMAVNKSASNVKQCNDKIKQCNRLMRNSTNSQSETSQVKKLTISNPSLWFKAQATDTQSAEIESVPFSTEWTANVPAEVTWIELSKSMDGKELNVRCRPNEQTTVRYAEIVVTLNNLVRKIDVRQQGKPVALSASSSFANFKLKGGTDIIDINCNSDTTYAGKRNWTIKKKPDWIKAEMTETTLILKTDKVEKNDPAYKNGRSGDIILQSQDAECLIQANQRKTFSINL